MSRTSRAVVLIAFTAAIVAGGVLWWRARQLVDAPSSQDDKRGASGTVRVPGLAIPPTPGTKHSPEASPREPTEGTASGSISGQVVDERGAPIAGAVVDNPRVGEPGAVLTDANGRFTLSVHSTFPRVDLRVRAPGFAQRDVSEVDLGAGDARIVVEAGRRVTGRVLDPDGRPVSGAKVWTVDRDARGIPTRSATGQPIDTSHFDAVGTAVSGADGTFSMDDLPAGKDTLQASARGFARSDLVGIEVPSDRVEIRLSPGVVLEGTVRDRDGKPIEGALVESPRMYPPYPRVQGATDANGRFRFDDLPPVRGPLYANADGFASAFRDGVLFGGPPVAFVLEPARGLVVRVKDPAGAPLVPQLDLYTSDGQTVPLWWTARNSEKGHVLVRLGEGPYTVLLTQPGFARAVVRGVRGGGPPVELAMRSAPLSISGQLPLADANDYVFAIPSGSTPPPPSRRPTIPWTSPDEVEVGSKEFEIRDLVEGRYDVLVAPSGMGGEWGGTIVHGVEAGTKDLTISLPRGEAIEGSVRRPDGSLVPYQQVQAYDERGFFRSRAVAGRDTGTFRLSGLAEGRYRVFVWLEEGSASLDGIAAPSSGVVVVVK